MCCGIALRSLLNTCLTLHEDTGLTHRLRSKAPRKQATNMVGDHCSCAECNLIADSLHQALHEDSFFGGFVSGPARSDGELAGNPRFTSGHPLQRCAVIVQGFREDLARLTSVVAQVPAALDTWAQ